MTKLPRSSVPWMRPARKTVPTVLVYTALLRIREPQIAVSVLYCDTGVEIPIVARLVRSTLRALTKEAAEAGLPIRVRVARPRLEDSFFIKVIGRGYPPPTNKFRWCTDRLRIDPVQRVISGASSQAVVLLSVRRGESPERDRTLSDRTLSGVATDEPFVLEQRGSSRTTVFAPMLNYTTKDVWDTLAYLDVPRCVDDDKLAFPIPTDLRRMSNHSRSKWHALRKGPVRMLDMHRRSKGSRYDRACRRW
jgi:DNA sulfur modification protein DndC